MAFNELNYASKGIIAEYEVCGHRRPIKPFRVGRNLYHVDDDSVRTNDVSKTTKTMVLRKIAILPNGLNHLRN